MARVPSSKDAQASLEASWIAPSKAGRASKARSGESEVITTGLFLTSSFKPDRFGHLPPGTSEQGVVSP